MIRRFCFLLLFSTIAASPPLIFVHLGSFLPGYYSLAMEQAQLFNPESDIYLLVESNSYRMFEKGKLPILENVHVVNVDLFSDKAKRCTFRKKLAGLPQYWIYTFERFFVIESFLLESRLTDVIHLEGDVLLYANVTQFLPRFQQSGREMLMAYANDAKAVPGLCYFKDAKALSHLTDYMIANYEYQSDMSCNDMKLIADSGLCGPLPVIPQGFSNERKLVALDGQVAAAAKYYEGSYEYCGDHSLFDAVTYGQILDGLSPGHAGHGKSGFITPDAVYQINSLPIVWEYDEYERRIPFITFKGNKYRLNNIHVHSKNLHKFISW